MSRGQRWVSVDRTFQNHTLVVQSPVRWPTVSLYIHTCARPWAISGRRRQSDNELFEEAAKAPEAWLRKAQSVQLGVGS
jgi:hypothetical protein